MDLLHLRGQRDLMADSAHDEETWAAGRDVAASRGDADGSAFAPAGRAAPSQLEAMTRRVAGSSLVRALLDVTDVSVVVLNRERQIVLGNDQFRSSLCADDPDAVLGKRPGEALGCTYAGARRGGCGTAPECRACGAVLAILESQRTGGKVERECLMATDGPGVPPARELHVKATQLELGDDRLTLVALRDVSDEKRRFTLERVFVHDLANTLTGLATWSHLLAQRATGESASTARHIEVMTERMMHEVEAHRALLQAEAGTLAMCPTDVDVEAALGVAAAMLDGDPVARGRRLELTRDAPALVRTDEPLLVRVLVNMLKNAFEASPDGGVVRAGVTAAAGRCEVRVWNEGAIAPEVAPQIFKRSFSSKPGAGRGLGTFSMKLIGERYLGGAVGFTSTPTDGTTFYIRLPMP